MVKRIVHRVESLSTGSILTSTRWSIGSEVETPSVALSRFLTNQLNAWQLWPVRQTRIAAYRPTVAYTFIRPPAVA